MYYIHVNVTPSPLDDTEDDYCWALWESISNALCVAGLVVHAWRPSGWLRFETDEPKRALDIVLMVLREENVEEERPGSSIFLIPRDGSRSLVDMWSVSEYRLGDGKWHRWGEQP